jgi:uncharacterized protein (DUF1800 family)
MALAPSTPPPELAWSPLDASAWNADSARHLLRRIGFSATPDLVEKAQQQGMTATLNEAFGTLRYWSTPPSMADFINQREELQQNVRDAKADGDVPQRRQAMMNLDRLRRQAYLDAVVHWMEFARQPENSAQENLVLFLSNVLVVAFSKVKDPDRLFNHLALLRSTWQQPYPQICTKVTYSPAMIQYLDLDTNQRGVANENYARELMELFTLGEGHYTENDIKEAARALTGIVIRDEAGLFVPYRWDPGDKTIFGLTGEWGAEDVVDLIFTQPAARTNLPRRFLAWYLTGEALPEPYLEALGEQWRTAGWRVDSLAQIVFSSKLFYDPQFRGALIKSPLRYYLGLCQDLNLDVSPFEGMVFQNLRTMGQEPFNAPNVRGWVGGESWINSTTLSARRELVQQLFAPVNENNLNADQKIMLQTARSIGQGKINVTPERIKNVMNMKDEELADHFLNFFLPTMPPPAYRDAIVDYLKNNQGARAELVREVVVALLQSPLYHVC